MMQFAIYGAGGFGREILPIAQKHMRYRKDAGFPASEIVFADDNDPEPSICGVRVIRFADLLPDDSYVLALGTGAAREALAAKCDALGMIAASIFHDSFEQGPDVVIGEGAVFCAGTRVTASTRIGRHFQCNLGSYVAHDCIIGDLVTFAPNVSCNGNVHIGDGAYIGTGAIIRNGTPDKPLRIGAGAIVGMGAVVTKDVPPGATVIGNPARVI